METLKIPIVLGASRPLRDRREGAALLIRAYLRFSIVLTRGKILHNPLAFYFKISPPPNSGGLLKYLLFNRPLCFSLCCLGDFLLRLLYL
jgi:hypothetical protein